MILGHEGTLQGPFYQGSPEISLTGFILGSIGGVDNGGGKHYNNNADLEKAAIGACRHFIGNHAILKTF